MMLTGDVWFLSCDISVFEAGEKREMVPFSRPAPIIPSDSDECGSQAKEQMLLLDVNEQ